MSAGCRRNNSSRHVAFELTPCHYHVILIDRVAYVTLWVAMAQMQLVTQPIAHSYRRTELWLYNYVRHAPVDVTYTTVSPPPQLFIPEKDFLDIIAFKSLSVKYCEEYTRSNLDREA